MRREPPILWLDGFELVGGGGRGDNQKLGGTGGTPQEKLGQKVPDPTSIPVPDDPAPVQEATSEEKDWKVEDAKKPPKPASTPKNIIKRPAKIGEKEQPGKTNIIRRGGDKAGDGLFDFGKGAGRGPGTGPGIGIGFGPGMGPGSGFGFGGYVGLMRNRIWSEWVQSRIYGSGKECLIGLTVTKSGQVKDIKIEKPSGDPFYDNLARRAVRNASPLPPLPSSFPKDQQRFRIKFVVVE